MTSIPGPLDELGVNAKQDEQLAYHRKHIRALWSHVEKLERFIQVDDDGSVRVAVGAASVTLKKSGDVTIKGKNIVIDGSGSINVKAGAVVTLKGSKVLQN